MPTPLTHDDPYRIGSYLLIGRLGSGGMGTVYLARSPGGRTVALKTMHARIASDPASRTRFRLETDAARVIGGLHGAQVVDADPQAETPWLATEYVLGPPLDDAVALGGPLPEASVRAVGAALCGALGQLHASDVVHRDLKPSNVMLTAYGPKVIDFGIARAAGDERLTRTGAAAGTPAFMSPEQATGQEHTPAGDVFALAGVLVFAATGHGPFGSGHPADLLYRVRYAEADLTGVPAELAPVLARCLAKDPAERPTTAELSAHLHDGRGEFADHLPDVLLADIARRAAEVWQYQPYRLPAPPQDPLARAAPSTLVSSRRKLLTASAGSLLGVAAAGGVAWSWFGPDEETNGAVSAAPHATPSTRSTKTPKRDHVWQVQVSGPPDDLWPAAASVPFPVGDQVALIVGSGLAGIDARTGTPRWTTDKLEYNWQVTSDGTQIYRVGSLKESEGKKGRAWPMVIDTIDLMTGEMKKRLPQIQDLNGVILEDQLVCAADGVIYLAAGQGDDAEDGFHHDQPWYLASIDSRTGAKRWSSRLPARPEGSERLHFLAGRLAAGRLILLQETADGAVRVTARSPRTGEVLWDRPMTGAKPDAVRERLTTDDRHVYLGMGPLRALRLSDGGEEWTLGKSRPGSVFGPPAVRKGVVYAVQRGRGIVAVDAVKGTVLWEEKGGEGTQADLTDRPVVGTKYVYNKGPSGLRAVDMSSRTTARTYKTTGTRFVAHERAQIVVALGGHFLAAFPLQ